MESNFRQMQSLHRMEGSQTVPEPTLCSQGTEGRDSIVRNPWDFQIVSYKRKANLKNETFLRNLWGNGEGNGTPLQYSCLANPMDGGAWWAAVHGLTRSWTRLSNFTSTFHFHALEKEMATLSSVLAWRIPGTGEPGRVPSMGSHRVRHDYWKTHVETPKQGCC